MKKYAKKIFIALLIVVAVVFGYTKVQALITYGNPDDDYCFTFDIDPDDFPVSSITINGNPWTDDSQGYVYYNDKMEYTIIIKAGQNADHEFPEISTPGGYDQYGTYSAVPNHEEDSQVEGDEYIFTLVVTDMPLANPDACYGLGLSIHGGPEPQDPQTGENVDINISINGDTLEYHYVEDKPDEADVTRISFSINEGEIVPFTFGNANYQYNNNPAPNNVSSVNTKNPIPYTYNYNGSGTVTFHFHGGSAEEFTKIQINGEDYTAQAPHTFDEIYEHIQGRAAHFDVTGVEYNPGGYDVHIEGERLPAEKQVGSFGWNYKKESEPDYDPNEDSLMTHGSLEFVSVEYDGVVYDSVSAYNSARYHGTGEVFEWRDGNRNYTDRRDAWGEALVPYGATLTIRIVPDAGYQLVSLTNSQTGFEALDEVGVYRLVFNSENMGNGADNFHLGAHFTEIDTQVNTPAANVNAGNIELNTNNDNAFNKGTAKFEVEDVVSMSPTRVEGFEGKAETEGYEVDSYLEMSLYNTIYKGGKTDSNDKMLSWDTEVSNLANTATVMLELADNKNFEGKDVAIIHETHDGNDITGYELIEANYNSQTNVVSFETNGFSSYAIVIKNSDNNDPQDPGTPESVTITFVTYSDTQIGPITIDKGSMLDRPEDPYKEGFRFQDWYEEPEFEHTFNFNEPVNATITLYAKYEEEPAVNPDDLANYMVEDESGNVVLFKDEDGLNLHFNSMEILHMSEAEIEALGITMDEFNQIKALIEANTKSNGTLIGVYEFVVTDDNGQEHADTSQFGNVEIRILWTDEMEGYNTFKLINLDDNDFSALKVVTLEVKTINNQKYLVGTLPHLSVWSLNASKTSNSTSNNPQTVDNITTYVVMLIVCLSGLVFGVKKVKELN